MRAVCGTPEGEPVDVMRAPKVTDEMIGQMRGLMIARFREQGWSFVAIGKLFRCSSRWVRAELKDFLVHNPSPRRTIEEDEDEPESEDDANPSFSVAHRSLHASR